MTRDYDVDGKWLGDHAKSCQRDKCKNPTGILINCFSCHRAFCKNCWKSVSKMVRKVKAAKGFESCSIEPRSRNTQPLLPGRALLPRGQSYVSSSKPAKVSKCLQDSPKPQSKYVVLSDSDDSGNETEKRDDASIPSVPINSAGKIRSTSKSQQSEQQFHPSKRRFEEIVEDSIEDVETQTLKRPRSSTLPLQVPTSAQKSPSQLCFSVPQPSYSSGSDNEQNEEEQGARYISEGRYHTLQEWAMEGVLVEQQNKQKETESSQAPISLGDGMLEGIQDADGRRQSDGTSERTHEFDSARDAGGTSTLDKGVRQRADCYSNDLSDNGNISIERQCESASKEQQPQCSPKNPDIETDIPSISESEVLATQSPVSKENTRPVQAIEARLTAPAAEFAQTQDRTQPDPAISSVTMIATQTGQQPNPALQTQQSQPQIYHRHHLPQPQSLASQEICLLVSQSPVQVNPPAGCSVPNGYRSLPAQSLEAHNAIDLQIADQQAAQKVFPQSGSPSFQTTHIRHAVTEQDVQHLSADQAKLGDGWFVQYNPQLPRVIDVSLLHTFQHESVVCCVRFSQNGKYMATGSNRSVRIFDALSGQEVRQIQFQSAGNSPSNMYVRCLCFSPNGKYLATGSEDRLIMVWSLESGEILNILTGHTHEIYSIDIASDSRTLATGSADCTVRLWDIEAGSQMMCLTTDGSTIASVAISPDAKHVAAGSYDNSVRVWDIVTGHLVAHLQGPDGHTAPVNAVAFSPNGKGIVSGSLDKTVKMWEFDTYSGNNLGPEGGQCFGTFEDHGDSVLSVAMTSDGAWILSGSKDLGVNFSDPHTRSCQLRIQGHQNSVISVATSPLLTTNGGLFATGSGDKEAKIWGYTYVPAQQNSQIETLGGYQSSPNGQPISQIPQNDVQQQLLEPQRSQSPPQKAQTLVNSSSGVLQEHSSCNLSSQHDLAQIVTRSISQGNFINTLDGTSHIAQQSSQSSSLQVNFPEIAAQAPQMDNSPPTMASPTEASQANVPSSTNRGSAIGKNDRKSLPAPFIEFLDKTRLITLQAPTWYRQRLEKLLSVKNSLPQEDVTTETHDEKRSKIERDIQKLEVSFQEILKDLPEEEKEVVMMMKERRLGLKRRQLEEHDMRGENRKEIEIFWQQVKCLRTLVPDVRKALQGLEVFLTELDF